jgi:acetyl esterase/lipase
VTRRRRSCAKPRVLATIFRSPRVGALLLCIVVVASACGSSSSRSGADETTTRAPLMACGSKKTFAYAAHPGVDPNLLSLDVYTPPAGPDGCHGRPLVIWIHGGGWTSGDKSEYMTDKVKLFNGAGYVFASVNYRLTDRAVPGPQYPVHDQDSADAVAWLVAHADQLGVDAGRVAVLGHSAGGGIVSAIATDDRYLGAHGLPLRALRCAGSLDGEGYDITAGATASPPEVEAGYKDVFGTDPQIWQEASPVHHVAPDKGIPPFFIATRGEDWRTRTQTAFIDALRGAGVHVTVLDATALEHIDLTTEVGAPGDTVLTPPLMAFLGSCFA